MSSTPHLTAPKNPRVFPGGCVVLSQPATPTPTALINALTSRGLAVRQAHDEPSVMTLFAERPVDRRILIVVEPGHWERLAELICALSTYHDEVLCWQFIDHGDARPRLKALDQRFQGPALSPGVDSVAPDESGRSPQTDRGPIGRIVGRRRAVDALLHKVPGRPLSTREVVTHQELTMLLGPVPGEAS